jgi:histidinol-phosphate/aromatic aminotransferase/cobyric acid decarboxylase-like protein
LEEAGIIIRDFNKDNTFRITVASSLENEKVVEVIRRTFLK